MKIAIYPGSFDPITLGHLNVIKRAARAFDHLIVCVMVNSGKQGLFTAEERVELIRRVIKNLRNVEVECAAELLCSTSDSVTEVALACGFGDVSYFGRLFRRQKGKTPGEYRRAFRS